MISRATLLCFLYQQHNFFKIGLIELYKAKLLNIFKILLHSLKEETKNHEKLKYLYSQESETTTTMISRATNFCFLYQK